jgi:hypothetical protein
MPLKVSNKNRKSVIKENTHFSSSEFKLPIEEIEITVPEQPSIEIIEEFTPTIAKKSKLGFLLMLKCFALVLIFGTILFSLIV